MNRGRQHSPEERRPKPKPVISCRKVRIFNSNSIDSVAALQGSLEMVCRPGIPQCDAPPVLSQRRSLDGQNRRDRVGDLVFKHPKSTDTELAPAPLVGLVQPQAASEQGVDKRRKFFADHPNQRDHLKSGMLEASIAELGESGRFHRPPSPRPRSPHHPACRTNTTHIFGTKSEADLKAAYVPTKKRFDIMDSTFDQPLSDKMAAQARRKAFAIEYVKPRFIQGGGSLVLKDEIPSHSELLEQNSKRAVRSNSVTSMADARRDFFGVVDAAPLSATMRPGDSPPPRRAQSAPRTQEWHGTRRHVTTEGNDKESTRVLNPLLLDTPAPRRPVSASPQRVGRYNMNAVLSDVSTANSRLQVAPNVERPVGRRTNITPYEAPKIEPRPYTSRHRGTESQLWGILGGPVGSGERPPTPTGRAMSVGRNSYQSSIVFC